MVLQYLSDRLHRTDATAVELEGVRDALLAFADNPAEQALIAKLLTDASVADRQTTFLLDTIDAMKLKELPSSWTAALSRLLDSTNPNVRIRTGELIRSRSLPGF